MIHLVVRSELGKVSQDRSQVTCSPSGSRHKSVKKWRKGIGLERGTIWEPELDVEERRRKITKRVRIVGMETDIEGELDGEADESIGTR